MLQRNRKIIFVASDYGPVYLVKAGHAAVQRVGPVIGWHRIDFTIQCKTPVRQSVGDTANGRSEKLRLLDIFTKRSVTRSDIGKSAGPVGNTDRLDRRTIADDPNQHAIGIGQANGLDLFAIWQCAENLFADTRASQIHPLFVS